MRPFTYQRVRSIDEALAAAARENNAMFIAGGTNLLDLMKLEIESPQHLIDLNGLPFDKIEVTDSGGVRIGALVRNSDLLADARIRRDYSVLARAVAAGASAQIRNQATVAGNLLQRVRCPYFYDVNQRCNKRSRGSGCPAIEGISRSHALLGVSDTCIAAHPSDMAVALRVLDATIETVCQSGKRRHIPIAEFYCLPDDTPQRETVLEAGELITGITLPPPVGGIQIYRKLRDRRSFAFALVSAAVIVKKEGSPRIALGGLASKPWRDEQAEKAAGVEIILDRLLCGATPTDMNSFKLDLARRLVTSILAEPQASMS